MRPSIFLGAVLPLALACGSTQKDACLKGLKAAGSSGEAFCATYNPTAHKGKSGLPAFAAACDNSPSKILNACHCIPPKTLKKAPKAAKSSKQPVVANPTKAAGKPAKTAAHATKADAQPTEPAAPPKPSKGPKPAPGNPGTPDIPGTPGTPATPGTPPSPPPPPPAGCTATEYSQVAGIVAKCKNIVLQGISVPAHSQLLLNKLQPGTTVTFAGKTTIGFTPDDKFDPIIVSGSDITITGAPGHVIDGNGPLYWDGMGSNGGSPKPDHFIVVKGSTNAVFTNLNIKNWPVHCFLVTGNKNLKFSFLHLDNSEGNAPNSRSKGKPAGHNSDGFDLSSNDAVSISDTYVSNQDDCVAIVSGTNTLIVRVTCIGGHGLSIGSVGMKSNNVVSGVTFQDSTVADSENGCRIKSVSGATGSISNILYKNIKLSNIANKAIDVQQDYLNGGPTGKPTSGVKITNVSFQGVTGTVKPGGHAFYILCGAGSCSNIAMPNTKISGGLTSCNFPSAGCPA